MQHSLSATQPSIFIPFSKTSCVPHHQLQPLGQHFLDHYVQGELDHDARALHALPEAPVLLHLNLLLMRLLLMLLMCCLLMRLRLLLLTCCLLLKRYLLLCLLPVCSIELERA